MKLPEPVAQIAFHYARNESNKITVDLPIETRLFTEAQMREALASHEAVIRMALRALRTTEEYLRIEVNDAYARDANINTINDWKKTLKKHKDAIKALEEQLK